jgi:hypothetical protein
MANQWTAVNMHKGSIRNRAQVLYPVSSLWCRNVPERHNSYNEVRERLIGNGQLPPRNAARGFGRGAPSGRGIVSAGRGPGDRAKGVGRGRDEDVKDPDYQR